MFLWLKKKEKRKAERLGVFEALYVDYTSDDQTVRGTGEARDISAGGVRFNSESELPPGLILNLTLRFAPGAIQTERLVVRAKVVRSLPLRKKLFFSAASRRYDHRFGRKPHRVACEFLNLDQAGCESIKSFIVTSILYFIFGA